MIMVEYPPGGVDPIHRHNSHGFIYVLEGSIVMQVKSGQQVTLTPGQTVYESPDDEDIVGRNASSTKPAKLLMFLVKDKCAPALIPNDVTAQAAVGNAKFVHLCPGVAGSLDLSWNHLPDFAARNVVS